MDDWVKFYLLVSAALVAQSFAQDSEDVSKETPAYESRNSRVSSEFGYNIQNSDSISSQFRQEQRDPNGVVRGSYGFKNPNGGFRFVQYVADDKGFRAHISSNENGIGKQNPASVSINRFEHQPVIDGQLYESKPPISRERLRNSGLRSQETQAQPYALDFYPAMQQGVNSGTNDNINLYSSFVDGNGSQKHVPGRNKYQSISQLNPVERIIKTRLGIPGELFAVRRINGKIPDWVRNPTNPAVSEYFSTEELDRSRTRISQRQNIFQPHRFPDSHNADTLGDSYSKSRPGFNNNFKNPHFNYPQFLSKLLPSEQHKVHTSLPDCDSASSAILCKPPALLSGSSSQQNTGRFPETTFDQVLPPGSFLSQSNAGNLERSNFPSKVEASDTTPHLMPNSYPLRFNIYKTFIERKQESERILREERECNNKKNLFKGDSLEHFLEPSESHRFIKDAVSIGLRLHNQNQSPYLNLDEPQFNRHDNENSYFSSLIKIVQNNHSLNTLKHLMTTTQTYTNKSLYPNMLGILILPSHLIKELNSDDVEIPKSKKTENFDEKNQSLFDDITSESDIKDQNKSHVEEIHENRPNTELDENTYSEENNSFKDSISKNGTTKPWDSVVQVSTSSGKHASQNSNNTERSQFLSNSRFFVFDDAAEYSSQDEMKNEFNKNSSSDDWRKILEGEISKEIERTSLQKETPNPNIPKDLSFENSEEKADQRHYMLNEHARPLYDSTGKPIKPENVPLHIHRYIPPAGITSFPWKFSIPRPAPPRSIVVPPKPPTLS